MHSKIQTLTEFHMFAQIYKSETFYSLTMLWKMKFVNYWLHHNEILKTNTNANVMHIGYVKLVKVKCQLHHIFFMDVISKTWFCCSKMDIIALKAAWSNYLSNFVTLLNDDYMLSMCIMIDIAVVFPVN